MLRRPPFVLYLTWAEKQNWDFPMYVLIFRSVITLKIWKSTLQTFVQWHDSSLNTLWCNDNKTNKLFLGPRTAAFTYPLKTGALVIKSFTNSFDKNLIKVQNFYEKIIIGLFENLSAWNEIDISNPLLHLFLCCPKILEANTNSITPQVDITMTSH